MLSMVLSIQATGTAYCVWSIRIDHENSYQHFATEDGLRSDYVLNHPDKVRSG